MPGGAFELLASPWLQIRLGAHWVGVVAQTDRARARYQEARPKAPAPAPPAATLEASA